LIGRQLDGSVARSPRRPSEPQPGRHEMNGTAAAGTTPSPDEPDS